MSYGNTLQTRLALNFDISKFGDAIDPYGDLDTRLSNQSQIIRDNTATVYTAIATGDTSTSTYFKNPVVTVASSLTSVTTILYNTIWDYYTVVSVTSEGDPTVDYILRPYADGMIDILDSITRELTENDSNADGTPKSFNTFISHTDRLSNLKQSNSATRPSFSSALSILQTVQTLVYQTETTSTSTVGALGLGVFTSLFIESDLNESLSTMTSDLSSLRTLLNPSPSTASPELVSLVTSTKDNFARLLSLLVTRRKHDENFYINSAAIARDLGTISSNKNAATTSSAVSGYLTNNLIGTDALKDL